jgi:hypothetical protein
VSDDVDGTSTSDPEQRVVVDFPMWLVGLSYQGAHVGAPIAVTVRVPIPPVAYLERWANQRLEYEAALHAQRAGVLGVIVPPEPTFDCVFRATEDNARAIANACTEIVDKATAARNIIDVH